MRPLSRGEVHEYWRSPPAMNRAKRYVGRPGARSVVRLAGEYVGKDARILELGCSVGVTLDAMRTAGYHNLTGIEINTESVELMRQLYPDLMEEATILTGSIEEHLPGLGEYDLIYSKAVLCHIHPRSETIFEQMAERARWIITVEDELTSGSGRHFPRNYRRVFAPFGFKQVEFVHAPEGMGAPYVARLLAR